MSELLQDCALYQEYLAEREEILRHKWLASEKAGYDIGFDRALTEWVLHYRSGWREARRRQRAAAG
ncbi:MAG: DUF4032 domain-containing protein [Verrucomicrobia bacterium]|jgi:hypothetical protein|nr:DUF4032 domain-containing protein [Verrucomicrobiota bacterium]